MSPTWAEMAESDTDKAKKAEKQRQAEEIKLKKKHHKKLRKDLVKGFAATVKDVLTIFDAIGVFSPVMDAAGGIIEIFSGLMQINLMPAMTGIIDALLGEEMMAALDLVAEGFSTILDPIMTALGTAIAAAPIGTALGVAIGGLIGSFAGNAEIGAVIGGAIGYSIEQAPIGGTLGTIVGGAIGNVIGGPFGAMIAAPIGAALGALIDSLIVDITQSDVYKDAKGILPDEDIFRLEKLKEFMDMGIDVYSSEFLDYLIELQKSGAKLPNFPAGSFMQGALPTFQGFQSGTPYVPESGIYHLTKGEAVISASENSGGTGDINITIKGNLVGQHAMRELIEEIEYKKSIGRL